MRKTDVSRISDKKAIYVSLFGLLFLFVLAGCNMNGKNKPNIAENQNRSQQVDISPAAPSKEPESAKIDTETNSSEVIPLIDESGTTMETRILAPEGYTRILSVPEELTGFLRGLNLKKAGSNVLLYNGNPKTWQEGHVAVFDLDIGDRDLQQCADSVIRIYAEYYWSVGAYNKIAFHLTNGFLMEYNKWQEGYRIVVDGNDVSWYKKETFDDSYEEFRNYLTTVFIYAGTLSLSQECSAVAASDLLPGDMFLQGGSPGHCVLVADVAKDKSGNRCFLLAQGFMPAQEFHILENPLHADDPWYYASEITDSILTPQWTFKEGSLVRWGDFPLGEAAKIY